ncbi:MAG: hypothetical protein ABIX11_14310 [Casimicrobiaceae bacterium]
MWDMFVNSFKLFFKGKLFRDSGQVLKKWLIGFAVALVAVVVLARVGVPLWLAVLVSALGAGALQPYLFRDLKYN